MTRTRTNPSPRVGPFHGVDLSNVKRTEPSRSLLDGAFYEPSWAHRVRKNTTWTNALAGHYGLVGHLRQTTGEHE